MERSSGISVIFAKNLDLKQSLFIFPLLSVFTAFSQSDSILTENKLNEVIISATKTNQTVNELPIPITIISEKEAKEMKPDYFLVLPWHFKNSIISREEVYMSNGGKFIFPLPEIEII